MTVSVTHLGGSKFEIRSGEETLTIEVPMSIDPARSGLMPGELTIAGLGACMLITGMEFALRQGIPVEGASIELKDEVSRNPVRISRIGADFSFRDELTEEQHERFLSAAKKCKVHNTLGTHPEIVVNSR